MISVFMMTGLGQVWAETLELLTWKGYAPNALVEKFEKETGITVKATFTNNEEMIAKLRATRGAGFDLAQPSQDRISSVQEKYNIYQPLDYSKIQCCTDYSLHAVNAVKKEYPGGGQKPCSSLLLGNFRPHRK